MSYETITNRLKLILDGVDGIHNVHTFMRDIPDEEKFEKAFSITQQGEDTLLTAWMMTRTSLGTARDNIGDDVMTLIHNIEIQGFYALKDDDESELKFQQIIDDLVARFRTRFQLEDDSGIVLADIEQTTLSDVVEIGHGQLSNYFVHFCRMVLSIKERLQ